MLFIPGILARCVQWHVIASSSPNACPQYLDKKGKIIETLPFYVRLIAC